MFVKMRRPSGTCEMPRATISCGEAFVMSWPSKIIDPAPAFSRPEMVRSVVDFPAPLAPMRVTISPSSTSIEMPFKARTEPYDTSRSFISSIIVRSRGRGRPR